MPTTSPDPLTNPYAPFVDPGTGGVMSPARAVTSSLPSQSTVDALTQDYTQYLGRTPDASGLQYWEGQVAGGTSLADIASAFKTSDEAKALPTGSTPYNPTAGIPGGAANPALAGLNFNSAGVLTGDFFNEELIDTTDMYNKTLGTHLTPQQMDAQLNPKTTMYHSFNPDGSVAASAAAPTSQAKGAAATGSTAPATLARGQNSYPVFQNGQWTTTLPQKDPYYTDPWHVTHTGVDMGNGTTWFPAIGDERTGTAQLFYDWSTSPDQARMGVSAPGSTDWASYDFAGQYVNPNVTYNGQAGFAVPNSQVANIGQALIQTDRNNTKYAKPKGSWWTGLRDTVEAVGAVAGNYFLPGSSLVTDQLVSKGAQQDLSTPIGRIANLVSGYEGGVDGNISNYGKIWDSVNGVPTQPPAPLSDVTPTPVEQAGGSPMTGTGGLNIPTGSTDLLTQAGLSNVVPNITGTTNVQDLVDGLTGGATPTPGIGDWVKNLSDSTQLFNTKTGQTFDLATGALSAAALGAGVAAGVGAGAGAAAAGGAAAGAGAGTTAGTVAAGTGVADIVKSLGGAGTIAQVLAALGLGGAFGGGGGSGSGGGTSGSAAMSDLFAQQEKLAKDLVAKYEAGNLNATDAYDINQWQESQTSAMKQYYASAGLSDSDMEKTALGNVSAQAEGMRSKALNQMLTDAISALSGASSSATQLVNQQLAADQQAQSQLNNFWNAIGKIGSAIGSTSTDTQGGATPP